MYKKYISSNYTLFKYQREQISKLYIFSKTENPDPACIAVKVVCNSESVVRICCRGVICVQQLLCRQFSFDSPKRDTNNSYKPF